MPRKDNANTPASAQAQQDAVSEGIENFELPRALVTRIAKSAVRPFTVGGVDAHPIDSILYKKNLPRLGSGECEATEGHGALAC
jgi:hypothetical protein